MVKKHETFVHFVKVIMLHPLETSTLRTHYFPSIPLLAYPTGTFCIQTGLSETRGQCRKKRDCPVQNGTYVHLIRTPTMNVCTCVL